MAVLTVCISYHVNKYTLVKEWLPDIQIWKTLLFADVLRSSKDLTMLKIILLQAVMQAN